MNKFRCCVLKCFQAALLSPDCVEHWQHIQRSFGFPVFLFVPLPLPMWVSCLCFSRSSVVAKPALPQKHCFGPFFNSASCSKVTTGESSSSGASNSNSPFSSSCSPGSSWEVEAAVASGFFLFLPPLEGRGSSEGKSNTAGLAAPAVPVVPVVRVATSKNCCCGGQG